MGLEIIGDERVFLELKKAISKALGVDEASITPESVLTLDLEAESLDFLDISYNLEQTFGFKMARHLVLEHAEEVFGEGSAIDDHGCLTDKGVKLLRLRFGEGAPPKLKPGMDMEEVVDFITVGTLASAIKDILETLPQVCGSCGRSEWKTEDGTHIICGACDAPANYQTGDDLIVAWLQKTQKEEKIF